MNHIIDIVISILLYSIAFNNGARSERKKNDKANTFKVDTLKPIGIKPGDITAGVLKQIQDNQLNK